jgi:hypothetical protein
MALPWFRVYSELLNSRKFHQLSDTLKSRLLCVWCLGAKHDAILPAIEDVAFALRIDDAEAQRSIEGLIGAGFLDRDEHGVVSVHDWQDHQHVSDVSTKRVQRLREKAKQSKQLETVSRNGVKPFPKRNETVQEAEEKQTQITPSAAETAAALKLAEESFNLGDSERAEAWKADGHSDGTPKKSLLSPEIESAIAIAAGRIHARHPEIRRCGIAEVKTHLRAILRREAPSKRLEVLRRIDDNHAGWCDTPDWQKENGQYAKGLGNWLAPTKGRWDESPPQCTQRDLDDGYRPVSLWDRAS